MKHESYGITGHSRRPSESRTYHVYGGYGHGGSLNEFPAWIVGQCTTRRELEQLRDAVAAEIARIDALEALESARIEAEEAREADTEAADDGGDDAEYGDPVAAAGELPTEAEPFRGARGVPVDDGGQCGLPSL